MSSATITAHEIKAKTTRYVEEVFNQGNLTHLDEFLTQDYIDHSVQVAIPPGREGYKQFIMMLRGAFPDLHLTIDDLIVEGDAMAMRWTATGTHRGEFLGIRPTGKSVHYTGTTTVHWLGGRASESWTNADEMRLMRQLDALPVPSGSVSSARSVRPAAGT